MLTSSFTLPLMAMAASAVIGAPSSDGKASVTGFEVRAGHTGFVDHSGKLDDEGNKISRRAEPGVEARTGHTGFVDYGGKLDNKGNKVSRRSTELEDRESDYISTCGSEYVPVSDFQNSGRWYIGYESAVTLFCTHITSDYEGKAAVIGPKAYAGTTIYTNDAQEQIGLDNGKDPRTSVTPGHIEFEIHNKQSSGDHTPTLDNCKFYLMKMAQAGQSCYRKNNKDTKGGTWQIGSDDISYHALPGKN